MHGDLIGLINERGYWKIKSRTVFWTIFL